MDRMEQFVLRSTISADVLGRDDKFLLAYLDGKKMSEADKAEANQRDFVFGGVVGLIEGRIEVEYEPFSICRAVVMLASLIFARSLNAPKGDSVSWLQNLHSLEDRREN